MVSLLDDLPLSLILIIYDYKIMMEEYDCFYAFLDQIYGTLGVF